MSESGGGVGIVSDTNCKYPKIKDFTTQVVKKDEDIDLIQNSNQINGDVFVPKDVAVSEEEKKDSKKGLLEAIKGFFKSIKKDDSVVLKAESGGGSN